MSRAHHGLRPAEWRALRATVFRRDGWACQHCGRRGRLECDHVIPLHVGGDTTLDNLQALCRDCHLNKTRGEYVNGESPEGGDDWDTWMHSTRYERMRP